MEAARRQRRASLPGTGRPWAARRSFCTADQFEHDPIVFDGDSFKVRPIDADGNGRYESLRLTGRVTVAAAGRYDLSAQLLADDGTLNGAGVDYAVASLELTPGSNDFALSFDGGHIRASGRDGPYELRRPSLTWFENSDIYGSGPTIHTGPLRAKDFEAGPADPNTTSPPDHDDPGDGAP